MSNELEERVYSLLSPLGSASTDLAVALGADKDAVRDALMALERLGRVYRTGQTRGTRWYPGEAPAGYERPMRAPRLVAPADEGFPEMFDDVVSRREPEARPAAVARPAPPPPALVRPQVRPTNAWRVDVLIGSVTRDYVVLADDLAGAAAAAVEVASAVGGEPVALVRSGAAFAV